MPPRPLERSSFARSYLLPLSFVLVVGAAHAGPAGPRALPALRYGDPVAPAARTPLALRSEALALRIASEQPPARDRPTLVADARLAAALEQVVARLPAQGPPPGGLTEDALWQAGIVEPVPYLLTMVVPPGAEDDVASQLQRVLAPVVAQGRYRRVAVVVAPVPGGNSRLALGLQESFVELGPVPRAVPAHGEFALVGRVLPPYAHPAVFVTSPEGSVSRLTPAAAPPAHPAPAPVDGASDGSREPARAFRVTVACGARAGAYQVEVSGEDRLGDAVLANFPVYCGVAPPALVAPAAATAAATGQPPAGATPVVEKSERASPEKVRAEAEARLFELLQKDRAAAGLPALTSDARLAAVARGHSVDMRDHGFFGHLSPSTGSAMDRCQRSQVVVVRVRENLARAYSPAELERGLMGSPSHRANILATDVDRVGIGVAVGGVDDASGTHDLYLTQLFARLPEAFEPARSLAGLRARLADIRRDAGLSLLGADPALDRVAREEAALLVTPPTGGPTPGPVARAIGALGNTYQMVRKVSGKALDLSQFVATPALLDKEFTHAGLAVLAGPADAGGAAPIYFVVLLAAKR